MKILARKLQTVGDVKKALENIPDDMLVNTGTKNYGYEITYIACDCMTVGFITDDDVVTDNEKFASSIGE